MTYYNIENKYTDNIDGSYTYELKNYKLEEVKRVFRILFPKETNTTEEDGWYYDEHLNRSYYEYGGMCSLNILGEDNLVTVYFGCSC
jgi:hypothetical protein